MGTRSGLRPITNNGGQPLRASERYGVKPEEWDKMADILEKAGNLVSPTSSSEEGPSIGVGVSLEGVMSELLELFGDIGTYGLLFKLAAFVKNRVEIMQDVEERAQQVAAQVEFIQERFEKGVCLVAHLCNCLSASVNQAELMTCEKRLNTFRGNLSLALDTRSPISDLPDLGGPVAVGIDDQIDVVLSFLGQTDSDEGVSCVVSFYGPKGVGKSRLMFEVQNRFPAKSTIDTFYTMDFAMASDPRSRLYLQRGLVEHLLGTGTASSLRSTESGKTTIRKCLAFLRTKRRRVLFAFDNVGRAEDLTSILPLNLSEELPAGSCILVSPQLARLNPLPPQRCFHRAGHACTKVSG